MGFICGWIGDQEENGEALLRGMCSRTAPAPEEQETAALEKGGTAAGGAGTASSVCRGGLCAAIEGHPRWTDRELERLAAEEGDAGALIEEYRRHGADVLERLAGDFALAVIDPGHRRALLAVDRLGIRPLAWSLVEDTLLFGSQISSLFAHSRLQPSIDLQGLFNYLYFHMVPSPGTLFENVRKLEPGQCLEYADGRVKVHRYWQLAFSERDVPERTLAEELHERLEQVVRSNAPAGSPLGTFLSGGLDSSTVTGVLQKIQSQPVDAFAIGFDAEGFDEMEYARATADHFGARLHQYYVTPQDVLEAIPLAAAAYDEPFGNASAVPAYYCARMASEAGKKLLLAGDGGDEIFAGNARYAKQKLFALYDGVPGPLKSLLVEPLARRLPPLRKLHSYVEQAKVPMPERLETYNFLHRFALQEIFDPGFLEQVDAEAPIRLLRSRWQQCDDAGLVKRMLFLDHKFTLADNDLRKVNRMCELAGIDVRYPLLQEEMVEFAAGVPERMLLRGQQLRAFYRRAMKGFLARKTLEKHKHGFGLPFGLWMQAHPPLAAFSHERLEGIEKRGFLNEKFIGRIIEAQQSGHATYYGVFIWVLVMLEEWLNQHAVGL